MFNQKENIQYMMSLRFVTVKIALWVTVPHDRVTDLTGMVSPLKETISGT